MSIEAMNWARKIYVGDAMGKSLLRAIADYADEHGHCWPSLQRLADDCDMSIDSVRRRIKLLEEIGVVATFRAWMDEHGKRNSEGRGRETSRDIRLLLEVARTRDIVDEAAEETAESGEEGEAPLANSKGPLAIGEGSQQLGAGSQSARGGVALVPPLEPPLKEDSPPSPPPGGVGSDPDREEPKLFTLFKASYPSSQAWDWTRVLPVFLALTAAEQERACAAALAYAPLVGKPKQPPPKRPDGWLRSRMFDNFPDAKLPDKPPEKVWICADRLHGLRVALRIADRPQPQLIDDPDHGLGLWRNGPIPFDLEALGVFAAQDPEAWQLIDRDSREFEAWRRRIRQWIGVEVEPRKRWLEPYDDSKHGLSASHPNFRMRRSAYGLPVPCRWPPKKDGTLYDDNAPPAQETDHG